ncbi:uncharacterized protein LOC110814778, partial [Carica papaya]|uniref:uncharacterized protein LOC110814778 n=1 Tax=Carica papaya TaxID=3649 RepID=UPI000B8CAB67
LKDQTISGVLCKIRHTQREGSAVAVLESVGSKGSVQVNGTVVSKSASCVLNSGDEVVFGLLGNHAYIFHQLVTDVSVKGAEIHNSLGKYMQLERRTGDPSAVAGASILASLSSLGHDLARWKLPSQSTSKINQATEVPTNSAVQNGMEIGADGTDGNSAANIGSDKAADSGATNKNLQLDNNQDPGIEAGNVKLSGVNDLLRPFLRMFAPSTSCNLKLSKSICKQVFDERIERTRDSQPPSTSGMPSRCTVFREEIRGGILDGRDLEVSFDNFPYYLSEHTKNVLIASSYIHLKHKELVNYASDLAAINPRILLSGPAGSEIYQEMLAKALANHFGAKLLIFDSHSFLGGLSSKEAELLKDGHNLDKSYNRIRQEYLAKFADRLVGEGEIPSSSVVPCSGSESQPKMETDPAPSLLGLHKFHMFKIGDRVKFMGSSGSLYPTTSPQRGPLYGIRGNVILLFEDNPLSKVGVKFDRPVPDGVDLGGLCEEGYGFFCNVTDLQLENTTAEDLDKLLVNTLFEVVYTESRSSPFILFLKDAEKSIIDSQSTFKSRLDKLPDNIVVIGSHTHIDNRKEKSHPGGLLFTKFGSNQTALLDLAFPDSFGRLHDRGKEVPKATKLLTKLFPNKVTIHMPQDEALLASWKHQLDRDAETLKMKGNLNLLRTVSFLPPCRLTMKYYL